jgi:integrase
MPKVTIPALVSRTTADHAGHAHGLAVGAGPQPDAALMDLEREARRQAEEIGLAVQDAAVGRRQGPRFVAFFGCMFWAMMRPAEVTSLTKDGCHLPDTGWGRLIFSESSPAAGREFTDDGRVHEDRGLKGRDRQARSHNRAARARRATRNVPVPPELVSLLREHIKMFGTGPGGRLFRSENGNPIQPSTYWRVWQKTRDLALTPGPLATPLMHRPYDLRHSGVTWRLNSGVPATEVAA